FIMAMAMNPEVQERAKEEIDRVVGADRLASVSDVEHLPFTQALIKETLRCHPTVPFCKQTAEDDIYNGFFVPKDTIVFPNIWSVHYIYLNL
ncbi:cytochrome P450, partial [Mycena floridula]